MIDGELLEILRCPLSRRPLVLKGNKLYCYESRKAYRIEDGIPVLLIEEAEEIPETEIPEEFRGKPDVTSPEV
ncbi:MAG: Trm112 family protein [Planctomycetota bacterium]